jgi:hypothetical protein
MPSARDAGGYGLGGDRAERRDDRKAVVQRMNFGPPDDGGQPQGRCEHGEMVADARPRPAAERQILTTSSSSR